MTNTWSVYEGMTNDELERGARGGDNLLARELAKRMGEAEDEILLLIAEMADEGDVT